MIADSFRLWLVGEVREVLDRKSAVPPLLLWLDPDQQWLDLLWAAAPAGKFELWADPDEHELVLRDRFYRTSRAPRVVWLPAARDSITWFKPFELEAEVVWEKGLLEALREFGVSIPREHESEMVSELPAYAREWFDQPKEATFSATCWVILADSTFTSPPPKTWRRRCVSTCGPSSTLGAAPRPVSTTT
jgi:hypothetical protein